MGWKSTLFAFLSIFLTASLNGQSCGENFYDSGGLNTPYGDNESETWTICPDNEGDLVTINFTFVDLENCCDFLTVFSGTNLDIPLISELTEPISITSFSDDGCITVMFSSDGSLTHEGWEASITCEVAPICGQPGFVSALPTESGAVISWLQQGTAAQWDLEIGEAGFSPTGMPTVAGVMTNPYTWEGGESGESYDFYIRANCGDNGNSEWVGPFSFLTLPGCGDAFYDSGGPNAPYSDNESEIWTICPDNEGDLVTINFTFVDLENCCDFLAVFSGANFDIPLISELTEPISVTSFSDDGCLTVTFNSNGFTTLQGWEASITCEVAPTCGEPGFVNTLPTASGAVISWLQQGTAAQWDLEIGEAGFSPTGVPTVAGVMTNPYTWEGGEHGKSYDFYIRANCGDDDNSEWIGPISFSTLSGCGDAFYDSGGPNAPYSNNESEIWTICPDNEGDLVTINFTLVDLEDNYDFLSIFTGSNTDIPLILELTEPTAFTSYSEDGCLTVTFSSDGSGSFQGWEAEIVCISCTPIFSQDIFIEDINAFDVQIDWNNFTEGGNYLIEYDTTGFALGEGNTVSAQDTSVVITGLEENTSYDYYFTSFCPDGQMGNVLGPFTFTTLHNNDLGVSGLSNPTNECGLGLSEIISIEITNYGSAPQALFGINYSVNGEPADVGMPQDGFFTGIVSNDSTEVFEFDLRHDFDGSGEYLIQAWTELEGDTNVENDTFSIIITNYSTPFFEDFEAGVIPTYMTTTFNEAVGNGHNSGSFVLFDNLFFDGDTLKAELPVLGPIADNDVLYFDFRYTDWSSEGTIGTTLTEGDILTVLISEDCGENYEVAYVLTGDEHEPTAAYTSVEVPLDGYAGSRIKIQILGIYGGGGDYWLDIDNINLPTCDKITLDAVVTHALNQNATDGEISVVPSGGIAPYSYLWDDGSTDGNRIGLSPGVYTVSLTDRFDCSFSTTIEVSSLTVSTETLPELIHFLQLMPNPTSGTTLVKASFAEALDTQVELVNLFGQTVWISEMKENITDLNLNIDLSDLPSAMYLVRIHAGGQIATSKLLKTE